MGRLRQIGTAVGILAIAGAIGACGGDDGDGEPGDAGLPRGSEPVDLDPAEFTTEIDNPFWPMTPGSRWVYREREDGSELRVEVTVTDKTKRIANGVEARVVRDEVTENGEPVEITNDWYAQDSEGNIWYLGEDTAEYENGKVTTRAGSFEAGVDGAQPGVLVPADPQPGQEYRQEHLAGEAEDFAEVLSTDASVEVPYGGFDGALKTKDVNPLAEPQEVEHKFYAKGVGPVLAEGVSGAGREELITYIRP